MHQSSSDQAELDALQSRLSQLSTERKEALNGNMAFSFGYDPAVAAIEQQIKVIQSQINLKLENQRGNKDKVLREVVTYDEEVDGYYYFKVGDIPSEQHGMHFIVNRYAALGPILMNCEIGQQTSFGTVVSVDGSMILSKQDVLAVVKVKHEQAEQQKTARAAQQEAAERQNTVYRRQAAERQAIESEHYRRLQLQEQRRKEAQSAPIITLDKAKSRLETIRRSHPTDTKQKSDKVFELTILHISCQRSHDAASSHQSDAAGPGAILGGILGLLGGPIGAVVGAGLGAAFGSASKDASEKDRWITVLRDVEADLEKMS